MRIWEKPDITIFNADFLKLKFPLNTIDLIVTSPPYNIGIDYGKYDDSKTYEEYLEFSKKWLTKSFSVLKDTGRLCINVPLDTKDHSLMADMTNLAKEVGFKYKGTIIWNKQNTRNKFAMAFSKNVEVILIFYKEKWTPVKKEFKEWVNEIWTFSGESIKRVGHPAPFPVEIPRRLVKMFSEVRNTVLDPFLGSGTTLIASLQTGRKGIGVEIDEKYFEVAKERIEDRK